MKSESKSKRQSWLRVFKSWLRVFKSAKRMALCVYVTHIQRILLITHKPMDSFEVNAYYMLYT
jgi:hypothetical protein